MMKLVAASVTMPRAQTLSTGVTSRIFKQMSQRVKKPAIRKRAFAARSDKASIKIS